MSFGELQNVDLPIPTRRRALSRHGAVLLRMLMMVPILMVIGLSGCSDSMEKAREKITAECRALGGKVGGLSEYWVKQCIKEHIRRFEENRPNFATHSKTEVFEYDEQQLQPEIDDRRANNPELLEHIEEKCSQAGVLIVVVEQMKRNGKSKSETVSIFKAQSEKVKDPPLGELIVQNTVMRSIDKIYSADMDVGEVAADAMDQCRERYESAMFLR